MVSAPARLPDSNRLQRHRNTSAVGRINSSVDVRMISWLEFARLMGA